MPPILYPEWRVRVREAKYANPKNLAISILVYDYYYLYNTNINHIDPIYHPTYIYHPTNINHIERYYSDLKKKSLCFPCRHTHLENVQIKKKRYRYGHFLLPGVKGTSISSI